MKHSFFTPFFTRVRSWYGRFERPISSLSLVGGFVFDALTLRRVDAFWENIWVVGHLLIVGFFMVLIHVKENEGGDETDPSKPHFWYVNILQFFFGGILSTYLVFYFRSADLFVTWPFILMLGAAFVANESMKRHFIRLSFQISLFFLSIYSFAIFLVPVVIHKIGPWVFLLSGLVSLFSIGLFIQLLVYFTHEKFKKNKKIIFVSIIMITAVVNFLYFTNLIPPVPLSLKDGGIFHLITKNEEGDFIVSTENLGWRAHLQLFPEFKQAPGSTVYAYSAVFSPTKLNILILHEWQWFNPDTQRWVTEGVVNLPLVGGREGGFRTYSTRENLAPGKWRVNVETQSGSLIGRLRFTVVPVTAEPLLETEIK